MPVCSVPGQSSSGPWTGHTGWGPFPRLSGRSEPERVHVSIPSGTLAPSVFGFCLCHALYCPARGTFLSSSSETGWDRRGRSPSQARPRKGEEPGPSTRQGQWQVISMMTAHAGLVGFCFPPFGLEISPASQRSCRHRTESHAPHPGPPAPAFAVTMDQGDKEGVTRLVQSLRAGRTSRETQRFLPASDATCHPISRLSQGVVPAPPSSNRDKCGY